jgi:hypothetical protein
MAWVRLHDGALSHPKVIGIFDPRDPFHLWVWGMSYSQLHLTDGWLPAEALPRGTAKASAVLLERGLWEPAEAGFTIHDFLDWNDSKELVVKKRTEAKERMRNVRGRSSREQDANVRESTSCEVLRGLGRSSSDLSLIRRKESDSESFAQFWHFYPRKTGKDAARRVWQKLNPSEDLVAQMLAVLAWQKQQESWLKDGGQFVPHPATWLNQGRWEDEPTETPRLNRTSMALGLAAKEFLQS